MLGILNKSSRVSRPHSYSRRDDETVSYSVYTACVLTNYILETRLLELIMIHMIFTQRVTTFFLSVPDSVSFVFLYFFRRVMDWRKGRPPRWSSPAANDNIVRTPRGPPGEPSSSYPVHGAPSGFRGRGNYQNDSRPTSRGDYRGGRAGYSNSSRQPTKGSFDSRLLLTLSNENTEPSEIIRHLGNEGSFNLALVEHQNDFDYLELILLALGNFCKKNGPTQFHSEFCPTVLVLFKHRVLSQVTAIIIQTSISREMTLQKGDRLKRLIGAVYHLASDIIVMLPSVACNFLGEDFFTNILSLKEMPSIQKLNISDAFDILLPAVERLKVKLLPYLISLVKVIRYIIAQNVNNNSSFVVSGGLGSARPLSE